MSKKPTEKQNSRPKHQAKRAPTENKRKKKEKIVMAIMIAAAVVMVLTATVVSLWNRWIVEPDLPSVSDDQPSPSVSGSPGDIGPDTTPDATPDIDAVEPLASGERKSDKFRTILVFGEDETSGLTDTIMVVSYDITNQKATVMSIPRDTIINVSYRSTSNKQINAQYKLNGADERGIEALKKEVSKLIGFVPDYYVKINWQLVGQMVDAIGGVNFDVPCHMGYDDPYQNLHIHFEPGYQHLDGENAMNLIRWRDNNDGTASQGGGSDLNRLNIQHNFLKAVLKQTLQIKNLLRIGQLAELFRENVVSDLSVENLYWFGSQAIMGGLSTDDVNFVTMPIYGTNYRHSTYWGRVCPIANQLLTLINESLNPYVQDVTLQQLDLIQISTDGNTLSSTTGRLADPSAGIPPATATPEPVVSNPPVESDPPSESEPPIESDVPVESDAIESRVPESAAPGESAAPELDGGDDESAGSD